MSKPDLDAIRARVEATTEGPWAWASAPAEGSNETAAEYLEKALTDDGPLFVVWVPATQGASEGYRLTAATGDGPHASMDAEFIANARQDIPNLLAYIGELENQLDEVRALVGPDNESGMISASAIFHTIGTGNKGDNSEAGHRDVTYPGSWILMCACGWHNAYTKTGKALFEEHLKGAADANQD